ncbi:MAG: polyprenyl glycosylphosphotransferase [Microbacteriaceae bacterium]|jgi:exopolysaccharide biosynthesis polyprenyl glycosylphosphotransferase|nr:polyprenyl glycosylphosphotransferase [Microbacteriaceae bacterium]
MNDVTVPRADPHAFRAQRQRFAHRTRVAPEPDAVRLPESGLAWARAYCARLRVTDTAIITLAVVITFFARFGFADPVSLGTPSGSRYAYMSLLVILCWSISLAAFRTRDLRVVGVGAGEYKRVVNASTTVFGLVAIVFLVAQVNTARWFFIVALPLGLLGLLTSRWIWRRWLIAQRKFGHYLSRVVVVGRRGDVESVVRQIDKNSGAAYTVVGAVLEESDSESDNGTLRNLSVLRDLDRVAEYATRLGADGVVVAGQPANGSDFIHDLAWELEGKTVELILATSLANVAGPRIHFRPVDGLPLLHVEIPQFEGGKHLLKRGFDVAVSALALIVLSPLFLILIALIRADSDGKAFFSQERVGRNGETFRILKFRSMVNDAPELLADLMEKNEGNGVLFKMKHDPRITRLGRTLRKYSLDELPQLWNVLVGDMSLVGPRPPLPGEVQSYEDHVRRRLYIKPGLTGMWQINGRSALSWEDSVRLDLYYVENWSVVGDLMILWRTVRVVINPVGAY